MNEEWKRQGFPEDSLGLDDHAVRVSMFEAFREDLNGARKSRSKPFHARAASRHLLPYVKHRLALLEWERRYGVLTGRIDSPFGHPVQEAILPFGWKRLINALRRLIANDAQKMIRVNTAKSHKLILKIEREAPMVERLLTVLGIDKESELRPVACLPNYLPPTDPDEPATLGQEVTPPPPGPPLNLSSLPARIKYEGKLYHRNSAAKVTAECDEATEPQLVAAVFRWGYDMPKAVIGRYLGIKPRSVDDRLDGYQRNARKAGFAEKLRKSQARRGMDAQDDWT